MPGPESSGLLDATALARIGDLRLRARTVVEGALAGMHRSPHHGASVEFAEHKEYTPGDEIRHIDWKAYGKFDKYYVKRFEDETELRGVLVVDTSASMGYAGEGVSKLDYAKMLAAALSYQLLRQQDQAGLVAFSDEPGLQVPPRGRTGHLGELLAALEALEARGRTDMTRAALAVTNLARRRSLVAVLSDLLDDGDAALQQLRGLRARRHDVVLFHVLDGDELRLPESRFAGPTKFVALEDDAWLHADPANLRRRYLDEVTRFVERTRRTCIEGDIEYHLVDTTRPPSEVLLDFLRGRARLRRRGA